MKLTDQGIRNVKQAPERMAAGAKALEAMGGKLLSLYMTMGEYDYVGIGELPSDEAVATFCLALGSLGNVKTTTMRAFSMDTVASLVKSLP
jgi:uncharacterized protein with GYD domain